MARAEALYTQILDEADLARIRMLPFARSIEEANLSTAAEFVLSDPQVENQVRAVRTGLRESVIEIAGATESRQGPEWPPQEQYVLLRRGILRLLERRTAALYGERGVEQQDLIARYAFAKVDYDEQSEVASFLGQAISDFMVKAQATPRDEMELSRLEAEVETNRSLLGSFRAQLIASDINQAMQITNLGMKVEILDPPQIPLVPVRPDKPKILLAALVLGPLLGIGFAFGTELLDPTLRTLPDFRRVTGLSVIGTAPLVGGAALRRQGVGGHWKTMTIAGVLLVTVLFFVAKATVMPDITTVNPSIQVVDPGSVISP